MLLLFDIKFASSITLRFSLQNIQNSDKGVAQKLLPAKPNFQLLQNGTPQYSKLDLPLPRPIFFEFLVRIDFKGKVNIIIELLQ